jgi:hypothetical protein
MTASMPSMPATCSIQGSRLPMLVLCAHLAAVPAMLELAAGECSTPFLGCVARRNGGYLHTYESDPRWLSDPIPGL